MTTTVCPVTDGVSTLVAVTVTLVTAVTMAAVSNPDEEMAAAGMEAAEATQVTARLPVPMTTAVHCSDAPEASGLAQLGTTEVTLEAGVGAGGFGAGAIPPPQPAASTAHSRVSLVVLILTISLLAATCQTN